jgi:signal transduction histidine kinase
MQPRDAPQPVFPAGTHQPFLHALIESLDTAVVVCDAKGRAILFNAAMAGACGSGDTASWERSEPGEGALRVGIDLSTTSGFLRNPDGSRLVHAELPLGRVLRGERVRGLEIHLGPDGRRPRTYRVGGQRVTEPDGRLLGALLILHDVTERRLADRFGGCELAVAEALVTAASTADAGREVLAAVGTRLSWPYGELWLVDEGDENLLPMARWVAPGHQPSGPIPDALLRGAGLAGEVWESGEPRWYADIGAEAHPSLSVTASRYGLRSAVAVPIRTAERFLGVFSFFGSTVGEPESSTLALLAGVAAHVGQFLGRCRADALALELTRTKDDFLALIGHELRTPLTSIVSHTELLLTDADAITGDNRLLLESVDRNALALRRIVTDLLDLAGLESGDLSLDLAPVDLVEVVTAATRAAGEPNDVKIELDAPPVLAVTGDALRLRELVDQLLSNAVKYSPDGGAVQVRLERAGERAQLTVADAGIGIPEEDRPRLFQRFFRSSAGTARGIPGTGLGLTLVRAITERHGGTISARHGRPGTTLVVLLPLAGPVLVPN